MRRLWLRSAREQVGELDRRARENLDARNGIESCKRHRSVRQTAKIGNIEDLPQAAVGSQCAWRGMVSCSENSDRRCREVFCKRNRVRAAR